MGQFVGLVELGQSLVVRHLVENSSGSPANADDLPTYRVYGPSGLMTNGTGSLALSQSGSVTAATNASPIVVTSNGHGLSTGTRVTIAGVLGNTAANGTFTITRVDANTFSLDSSTGNGSYTSGGTWNVTGLYQVSVAATAVNGYAAGSSYSVLVRAAVSSTTYGDLHNFGVV